MVHSSSDGEGACSSREISLIGMRLRGIRKSGNCLYLDSVGDSNSRESSSAY